MHNTELRWIEIADERHFREEVATERRKPAKPRTERKSPFTQHRLPTLCGAMSSLPSRILDVLHLRLRRLGIR